jgi:DNA repair exonuclease SbcCD nuclease subunit
MFKFLHAADIHLDSPLHKLADYEGAPVDELRHATRRALKNMVDLAAAEEVAFVLIAGDLYDGDWKDYNTGLYFISQMSRLREADIPVYIVAGNHDAQSKITKTLRLPEGVRLFADEKPETLVLNRVGVAIHGQSFRVPAIKKNLAAAYPTARNGHFNIGLLHTCATGREGHEPYAPCSMGDLQNKGYDYWALGHVHQREVLLEDPLVLFPGNIQGRHVKESGPKGCMLVSVDDRGRAAAHFRPLDVIRWFRLRLDVSGRGAGYDVIDAVAPALQEIVEQNEGMPMVVRVEVLGACPAHDELVSDPERWTNEIRSAAVDVGGGALWIEKVKLLTEAPHDVKSLKSAGGPVAEIARYLDEVQADPSRLRELAGALGELNKKLPKELREGEDGLLLDDQQWVAGILGQVRSLLIHRLMAKGKTP